MRRASAHGVDKRRREHFVGWFERKVSNFVKLSRFFMSNVQINPTGAVLL
jgi:hypothetical protein